MARTPPPERALVTLAGTLHLTVARRRTASEHPALVLDAGRLGRLVLTRLGGPSFGAVPDAALDGQRARVTGYLLGHELRYTEIVPLGPA